MEISEYRKNALHMIALTRCAVHGGKPPKELIDRLDLPVLFQVCQKHILTACVAYALESAGIHDKAFSEAKEKSIRKNILLDAERAKVLCRLEQERIWYMPLKGAIIKDWYPKLGMRQMSDNDILCDGAARKRVRKIMEELGFSCDHYEKSNDDAYFKPPVCNFEMHNELFSITHVGKLYSYYENVKERLLQDLNSEYGYHFRNEDFYIYVLAHEYKHYSLGGTGVRSLLDTYIMLREFGDTLDWNYIAREFETLGMSEYAEKNRLLAEKVFSGEKLTQKEKQELDYYITSGVYGTTEHHVENQLKNIKQSKAKYVLQRFFPSMKQIKASFPFFYRHKYLIPVLLIWRPIRGLLHNRKRIAEELKYLMKHKQTSKK